MKTFEEKWTAWLDGQLTGRELSEFEASLPDKAAAEAEKTDARKLGALLKRELGVSALANEDFFSHQVRERISESSVPSAERETKASTWWTIPRLLWTGTASLAVFLIFTIFVMREKNPAEESQYLTQILNARVDPVVSPNATVSIFEVKQDRVTVLWTEGLQSLPADYAAKQPLMGRSPAFLISFIALTIGATHALQGAETVWSGLVIAENVAQPQPMPPELTRIEGSLKKFFGYNQFEVIGQSQKTLKTGQEDWLATSKFFGLHVDARGETEAGYVLNLKLYKEKELLLETDTKLSKRSPLVIKGPQVGGGQLLLVLVVQ